MKAVILAGGLGTRLSEETETKPMVGIGERPIIWHIMKKFSQAGVTDFIIYRGYKGYIVKEYFVNYRFHANDIVADISKGSVDIEKTLVEDWRVSLIDTGEHTMTGGRPKRIRRHVGDEPFFMTYGDGVSDIDLRALAASHARSGCLATVTAVSPPGRFGALEIDGQRVTTFREKLHGDQGSSRRLLRALAADTRLR